MRINCAFGLNETEACQPNEALTGYNFDLTLASTRLRPRMPIDLKATAPNGGRIAGIMQLIDRDDTDTMLVAALGDVTTPAIYAWTGDNTSTAFTNHTTSTLGLDSSSALRGVYWPLDDYLTIVDIKKLTPLLNWDGTTLSKQTTALGAVELYAKYGLVHNGRMWLFNITTDSTENPHMILASGFETAASFDTVTRAGTATGNDAFYQLSPDLREINGAVLYNQELIISTVGGALHKLTGTDASSYAFQTYYPGSSCIGEESIAVIGNDVIWSRQGGGIDLLSTTDTSGDVRADDVSRWIPDTVANKIPTTVVYDQQNQKVLFFYSDRVMALYKDLLTSGGGSPWSYYKTVLLDSAGSIFDTWAATPVRIPSDTQYTIYFGDEDGNIYDMNGTSAGDNGEDIAVLRKTPFIEMARSNIMRGYVQYRRLGEFPCSVLFDWGNEYNTTQSNLTLKGDPDVVNSPIYAGDFYFAGDNYFSTGDDFTQKISRQNFSPAGRSEIFNMTFYAETTVRFQVDFVALLE